LSTLLLKDNGFRSQAYEEGTFPAKQEIKHPAFAHFSLDLGGNPELIMVPVALNAGIGEFCPSDLTVKKLNVSAIYPLLSDNTKCFDLIFIYLFGMMISNKRQSEVVI
jgi:hypothetical protein